MKKFLSNIFASLLCLALASSPAGSAGILLLGKAAAFSCTPGAAATNYLARMSGLSANQTIAACTFVNDLVAAGAITGNLSGAAGCGSVLDLLYFFPLNNKTNAFINVCGTSFGLTETATVTCTADIGCAGDGVSGLLTPGTWDPSLNCVNCTQDSSTLFSYIQSTTAVAAAVSIGTGTGGAFLYMVPVNTGNVFSWDVNGLTFPSFANSNPQGAWVETRNGTPTTSSVYLNGSTIAANAVADTSTGLAAGVFKILALNNGGTASNFSNYVVSCTGIGKGVTSTMAFAINNACNHAMTVLGHNIY